MALTTSVSRSTIAGAVADQIEAAKDLAEDGAREQASVGHVLCGGDIEDRWRGDAAQREQTADPDDERQHCGEPQQEHQTIIMLNVQC